MVLFLVLSSSFAIACIFVRTCCVTNFGIHYHWIRVDYHRTPLHYSTSSSCFTAAVRRCQSRTWIQNLPKFFFVHILPHFLMRLSLQFWRICEPLYYSFESEVIQWFCNELDLLKLALLYNCCGGSCITVRKRLPGLNNWSESYHYYIVMGRLVC